MATLLIVDDDNNIRETLNELLTENHECHTADRAEQALAYLELEDYDAVLTDIAMPGLSGREILKCTQKLHPATPVIVISGDDEYAAKELIAMGAFAYLTKPFQLDEVEATVNRAIIHHQELVKTLPVKVSNEPTAEDAAADPLEPS